MNVYISAYIHIATYTYILLYILYCDIYFHIAVCLYVAVYIYKYCYR